MTTKKTTKKKTPKKEYCKLCGMEKSAHVKTRAKDAPVPRVPCIMLLEYFQPMKAKAHEPTGRPTKLTMKFLEVAREVLFEGDEETIGDGFGNALVLTDEELLFLINEKLEEDEQVTQRTFERWKANARADKVDDSDLSEEEQEITTQNDDIGQRFCRLMKKALLLEKTNLIGALRKGKSGEWQKYAWIMERKFDEWNIKAKVEVDADVKSKGEKIQGFNYVVPKGSKRKKPFGTT